MNYYEKKLEVDLYTVVQLRQVMQVAGHLSKCQDHRFIRSKFNAQNLAPGDANRLRLHIATLDVIHVSKVCNRHNYGKPVCYLKNELDHIHDYSTQKL